MAPEAGPVATAVGKLIPAPDDELADPVAALADYLPLRKGENQLHLVPAGDQRLQEEPNPAAAGEAGVGFLVQGVWHADHSGASEKVRLRLAERQSGRERTRP